MSHVTNVCVIISRSVTQEVRVVTGRVSYWLLPFSFHSSCSCAFFCFNVSSSCPLRYCFFWASFFVSLVACLCILDARAALKRFHMFYLSRLRTELLDLYILLCVVTSCICLTALATIPPLLIGALLVSNFHSRESPAP